jgi:hypothetical protein
MRRWFLLIAVLVVVPLAFNATAWAKRGSVVRRAASATTVLHFDELPFQPVNGLTVKGVTFAFAVAGLPSTDAGYNSGGPGCGSPDTNPAIVCDPSLEGNATGALTLTFTRPTKVLRFGTAVSCFACVPIPDGAHITLYRVGGMPLSTDISLSAPYSGPLGFSETWFTYSGWAVYKAVITFPEGGVAYSRFVIDNLTYETLFKTIPSAAFTPGGTSWSR